MADIIDMEQARQVAGGKNLHGLRCNMCGSMAWCPLIDDEGCISVLACVGYDSDGIKCNNLFDLEEDEYEYESE